MKLSNENCDFHTGIRIFVNENLTPMNKNITPIKLSPTTVQGSNRMVVSMLIIVGMVWSTLKALRDEGFSKFITWTIFTLFS